MSVITFFLIFSWLSLLVVGQMLFKYVSAHLVLGSAYSFVASLVGNIKFWMAIILYGAATVLWVIILRIMPLSKALPFTAFSFILVPILSVYFWNEELCWHYWLGVLCIVVGVMITTNSVQ